MREGRKGGTYNVNAFPPGFLLFAVRRLSSFVTYGHSISQRFPFVLGMTQSQARPKERESGYVCERHAVSQPSPPHPQRQQSSTH